MAGSECEESRSGNDSAPARLITHSQANVWQMVTQMAPAHTIPSPQYWCPSSQLPCHVCHVTCHHTCSQSPCVALELWLARITTLLLMSAPSLISHHVVSHGRPATGKQAHIVSQAVRLTKESPMSRQGPQPRQNNNLLQTLRYQQWIITSTLDIPPGQAASSRPPRMGAGRQKAGINSSDSRSQATGSSQPGLPRPD